ncbi:hypothetical protein ACH5RR_004267 [Cinchona calisaya]|uniref:Uncharacterized protein n=1 Tax=Cinchona calisaya TaxID=153742 RepID=A0ABD3AXJ0_9GENT
MRGHLFPVEEHDLKQKRFGLKVGRLATVIWIELRGEGYLYKLLLKRTSLISPFVINPISRAQIVRISDENDSPINLLAVNRYRIRKKKKKEENLSLERRGGRIGGFANRNGFSVGSVGGAGVDFRP